MPQIELAEDFGGFEPPQRGQYHVVVTESAENPPKRNGQGTVNGNVVAVQILEGTARANGVCTEVGKHVEETIANPNLSNKDGGKFLRQKITNYLIATDLVPADARGKTVNFEWAHAIGKQMVVFVETYEDEYTDKDGVKRTKTKAEISGANFYHITDPRVAHVPKDVRALNLAGYTLDADGKTVIPKAATTTKPPANGNGATKQPAAATVAAGAGGELDLDNL